MIDAGARTVDPVVAATGLVRSYPAKLGVTLAVDHADLSVASGEVVGISGRSGSGKSTLLRLLGGIERPDHGTLSYAGQPAWRRRRSRRASYPRPGYAMPIFQDPVSSLDWRWPIGRSLTEPIGRGHRASERRAIADEWLDRAQMGHVQATARPHELSGGQCQRVALLRALIARPSVLVADEPTARQDVITAAAITRLLREAADRGTAIIVVSHDIAWLSTFVDRSLEMRAGRLEV
jgi:peptide/nickel transport system ATP-binding protein